LKKRRKGGPAKQGKRKEKDKGSKRKIERPAYKIGPRQRQGGPT